MTMRTPIVLCALACTHYSMGADPADTSDRSLSKDRVTESVKRRGVVVAGGGVAGEGARANPAAEATYADAAAFARLVYEREISRPPLLVEDKAATFLEASIPTSPPARSLWAKEACGAVLCKGVVRLDGEKAYLHLLSDSSREIEIGSIDSGEGRRRSRDTLVSLLEERKSTMFYESPWFWAGVGGAAVLGLAVFAVTSSSSAPTTFDLRARIP